MKQNWMRVSVATLATCALLAQGGLQSFPMQHSNVTHAATSIANQVIKLSSSATLTVRDGNMLMQDAGKVFAYTITITNNGSTEINMRDYFVRLKSKSGKKYTSTVIEADKTKGRISPKTTQNMTYYAVVDNAAKLSDLTFDIIKWDFNASNYERKLGTISYPSGSTDKVTAYQAKTFLYNNTNIKGSLKQYTVNKDNNNLYVTMNILLENAGLKSVDLTNMKFYGQADTLAVYNVNNTSLSGVVVQPKEKKVVTISATFPLSMAGKPFSLIAAVTNEATVKSEVPAGVFAMPLITPSAAVVHGVKRAIYMNGESVNTNIGLATLSDNEESQNVELDYTLENTGGSSIAMPEFNFTLITSSGVSYPLAYNKEQSGTTLLPKLKKSISLTGQIPEAIKLDTAKLIVRAGVTEKDKGYVIGTYQMKQTSNSGNSSNSFIYSTSYNIKLNSIERLPMEDNDVIVADLSVLNISKESKKAPKLSGYFIINGVRLDSEHQKVLLDNSVNIEPNANYNLAVYAPVPYTTDIKTISFVVTDQPAATTDPAKKLYQYAGQSVNSISSRNLTQPYHINSLGKRAEISVIKSNFYVTGKTTYFYSEYEVTNKEARAALLASLGGYLEDSKSITVPLQFTDIKEKIMPNGKVLITAWSKVSKYFDRKDFKLIIGQSVTSGTAGPNPPTEGSPQTPEQKVIVKPVAYKYKNLESSAALKELLNIPIAGNILSFKRVQAYLNVTGDFNVSGLRINLNYDYLRDEKYDYVAGDHQLQIEFVDQGTNKTTYSKTFALKANDTNTPVLNEAVDQSLTIDFEDSAIQTKVQNYENYVMNIYDVFQGAKVLVATKQLRWFYVE
ncbi:hypothetical protein ACFO9Q_13630 [Paenibacillus sp. GCM10023252]|uniref:hypothetical protein n=1 Tax=Paenibacillus sp. GCM10023252 TaxID=3252649 RepID=UPI00360D1F89